MILKNSQDQSGEQMKASEFITEAPLDFLRTDAEIAQRQASKSAQDVEKNAEKLGKIAAQQWLDKVNGIKQANASSGVKPRRGTKITTTKGPATYDGKQWVDSSGQPFDTRAQEILQQQGFVSQGEYTKQLQDFIKVNLLRNNPVTDTNSTQRINAIAKQMIAAKDDAPTIVKLFKPLLQTIIGARRGQASSSSSSSSRRTDQKKSRRGYIPTGYKLKDFAMWDGSAWTSPNGTPFPADVSKELTDVYRALEG